MSEQRSQEARGLAESALIRLIHAIDDDDVFLVVLGGLVPEYLASESEMVPEHLGTTDVDVLLISHVGPLIDLGLLESVLDDMEFNPDPNEDGWRWRGPVDGVQVKLEFLCDLDDQREGEAINPIGCNVLSAMNLRGTGYAALDYKWESLSGTLENGTRVTVRARLAGLGGYLLSKCVAARTRGAEKDFYDFVYVLQHNRAGGPEEAAANLLDGPLATKLEELERTFIEVQARFEDSNDVGPRGYASQALQVEPESSATTLRLDAVDVVERFFTALNSQEAPD